MKFSKEVNGKKVVKEGKLLFFFTFPLKLPILAFLWRVDSLLTSGIR